MPPENPSTGRPFPRHFPGADFCAVRRFLGVYQEFLHPRETLRSQSLCKRLKGDIRCVPGELSATQTQIGIMTTANFYVPAAPLQSDLQLTKELPLFAKEQPSFTRRKLEAEPEKRLWKICAKAASPRLSGFERIALLVFGASGFVALACCVFEWLQLSNSGSLDQVVRVLLTR
jgi:hypothetical protein